MGEVGYLAEVSAEQILQISRNTGGTDTQNLKDLQYRAYGMGCTKCIYYWSPRKELQYHNTLSQKLLVLLR